MRFGKEPESGLCQSGADRGFLGGITDREMTTESWASVDEVREHLGVTKDTVYRWIEKKGLPAHKIGRLWKFKLSEVDDWVRSGGAANAASDGDQEVGSR